MCNLLSTFVRTTNERTARKREIARKNERDTQNCGPIRLEETDQNARSRRFEPRLARAGFGRPLASLRELNVNRKICRQKSDSKGIHRTTVQSARSNLTKTLEVVARFERRSMCCRIVWLQTMCCERRWKSSLQNLRLSACAANPEEALRRRIPEPRLGTRAALRNGATRLHRRTW